MHVFIATLKIIATKYPRYIMFILISAALILCFGILGRNLLYSDKITDPISVIMVDNDNSTESRLFAEMFREYELYADILNFRLETDEDAALSCILNNTATAVLILPEDFAENVKNGANEPFVLILNEAHYLKKTLVEYFAVAFSDMLSASQSGVYAALDYTREFHPDELSRMFYISNLKFMKLVLNRAEIYEVEEHTVISALPFFTHFILAFLVFINITMTIMFIDILYNNFNPIIIKKMKQYKNNFFCMSAQFILAFFLAFLTVNTLLIIVLRGGIVITPLFIVCAFMVLLCVSAFLVFSAYLFKNAQAASIAVSVFAFVGLFVSGGIIPREFFTPFFRNFSYLTLNFWLYELLASGLKGNIDGIVIVFVLTCAFYLLSVFLIGRVSKSI